MSKNFVTKPNINKKNNQINISIPRKIISKEIIEKISSGKKIKVSLK